MYGEKIRIIRELRGFSQEHMASKLNIAQNSYSRIEKNQTKLTAEWLEKIAKELGVSPVDIMSAEPAIINLGNVNGTLQGNIENFYSSQKELLEAIRSTLETITEQNKLLIKYITNQEKKE